MEKKKKWRQPKKPVVLAKSLECPLDSKKIKPVSHKRNQPWIFIGKTCWSKSFNTLATWSEESTHWKTPWCWERLRARRERGDRGWDGWIASLTQWNWVWQWRTGKSGVLQFLGGRGGGRPQIVRHNLVTELETSGATLNHEHSLSVQLLSCVWILVTPWTRACQASLSITNSQSLLKLMYIKSVVPSNHLILWHPLLLLPLIFPSIRVFSNESVLLISWPNY